MRHDACGARDAPTKMIAGSSYAPLFLYLAYQAIHKLDEAPMRDEERFNATIPDTPDEHNVGGHRRKVAGMVACLDEGVGNVTTALDAAGMRETTLIVFSTDNGGPAAGFNNNLASNWPLRGMKRTLWEGGVRAVGIVSGAGVRMTGRVSDALLHVTDLPISLLSLAANGLGVDPRVQRGSRGETTLNIAARRGAHHRAEPPMQWDGVDNWAAIAAGAVGATEVLPRRTCRAPTPRTATARRSESASEAHPRKGPHVARPAQRRVVRERLAPRRVPPHRRLWWAAAPPERRRLLHGAALRLPPCVGPVRVSRPLQDPARQARRADARPRRTGSPRCQ